MAITVTMPQLGESVTEGTIGAWLVQPGQGAADGYPDDRRLGERAVDNPLLAELLEQPSGGPEHPTLDPHVLTNDDHPVIPAHLLPESVADGLHVGDFRHLSGLAVNVSEGGVRIRRGGLVGLRLRLVDQRLALLADLVRLPVGQN